MSLFARLLDVIYPPRCAVCGLFLDGDPEARNERGGLLCGSCLEGFRPVRSPRCTVCGIPFPSAAGGEHLCGECIRKPPRYDAARAPYLYAGTLLEALRLFKYGRKSLLGPALGGLLARFAREWLAEPQDLLVLPVPLHPRKVRERGFNQSLLLAQPVARELQSRLDFRCLKRVRYTAPQTGLGKEERRRNVRNAFEVAAPGAVDGHAVLLIDDVYTTGNTLNECARVLRKAGCRQVLCLTLARRSGDLLPAEPAGPRAGFAGARPTAGLAK